MDKDSEELLASSEGPEEQPLAEREVIPDPNVGPGSEEQTQEKQEQIGNIIISLVSCEQVAGQEAFVYPYVVWELEEPLEQQGLQSDLYPPSQPEVLPATQEGVSFLHLSQPQVPGMGDQQQGESPELHLQPQLGTGDQQEPAPGLPFRQPQLVQTVIPNTKPLLQLPFTATVLEPQDKPKNYVYTNTFDMLLTKPNKPFTIDYCHDQFHENQPMYVRATLQFADPTQAAKRVETCKGHSDKLRTSPGAAAASRDELWARSVLKSYNPGPGVFQCGDPDDALSCFSVAVKATGSHTQHTFYMECMNSCSSGMANRKTLIVFTLEDQWGKVYARHVMNLRSCSSPYRDLRLMMQQEKGGQWGVERGSNEARENKRSRLRAGSAVPDPVASTSTADESTDVEPMETDSSDVVSSDTDTHNIPTEQHFGLETIEIPDGIELTDENKLAYARFFLEDFISNCDPLTLYHYHCLFSRIDPSHEIRPRQMS